MNDWIKDCPVGTPVLCTAERGRRKIVAIKTSQGTHPRANPSMWASSDGPKNDAAILTGDPERLWRDSEVSVDRYEEGFEDGYREGRLDERVDTP